MSTVLSYQLRAHMSYLAHIGKNGQHPQPGQQHQAALDMVMFSREDAPSQVLEPDGFWSPRTPAPLINGNNVENITRINTDIRISLRGPSPDIDQNSEEFRRQAREIKKDIQRISKYENRYGLRKCKSSTCQGDEKQTRERLFYEHEFRRRVSVNEGRDFLLDFVQHHFPEHVQSITVKNTKTLEEIKMIGNECEPFVGIRQCRRLFNAPVISDQVGLLLWQELRQGDGLDHSHEFRTDDEAERDGVTPQVIRRRRAQELARLTNKYIAERQAERQASLLTVGSMVDSPQQSQAFGTSECLGTIRDPTGETPEIIPEAMITMTGQAATSFSTEKKTLDVLFDSVRKSAVKSATQFAASLSSGYA